MAEYEKKVRKILKDNNCIFIRRVKETMTYGTAQ